MFLCAKWDDKYKTVSMCIPEIETKLKGIFTFQTQAFFHLSLYLEEGRLELGGGIQSAILFYVKWAVLLHPCGKQTRSDKVAKSDLACRPWPIFLFLGGACLDLILSYHVDPCCQLKIWRSSQDGDNNWWIVGSDFSVQKYIFVLVGYFVFLRPRWIIDTFFNWAPIILNNF